MRDRRPIDAQDYRRAIDVQDACNLSGVAKSLFDTVCRIESGTADRNRHHIVRMYVAKLADLSGLDYTFPVDSWEECENKS